MKVYQVLNEENKLYREYSDLDHALHCALDLTVWDDEHYYHVEELALELA